MSGRNVLYHRREDTLLLRYHLHTLISSVTKLLLITLDNKHIFFRVVVQLQREISSFCNSDTNDQIVTVNTQNDWLFCWIKKSFPSPDCCPPVDKWVDVNYERGSWNHILLRWLCLCSVQCSHYSSLCNITPISKIFLCVPSIITAERDLPLSDDT